MKLGRTALGFVGVFLMTGVGFAYWSNQPAVTKITQQPNVKGAATPDYTLKEYANDYYATRLPARFTNRTSTIGKGQPILLQQLFGAPGDANMFADQLAITVGVLPSGGIQDVADVQLRNRTPTYTSLAFPWLNPSNGAAFERADQGYELDIFLIHDKHYTAIVLSGLTNKKDQLTHEMQLLVNSIRWR